jgi:hypothetical protein
MATALDLITRAMKLGRILADGETPTASEANDALAVLNDMLENWSTEPQSVWSTNNFTGTLNPLQSVYTIGPTGDFVTIRPSAIHGAYCKLNGVDFPVDVIGQLEYNDIHLKTMEQPIVNKLLYVNDYPNGIITVWPVPIQQSTLTLTFDRLLTPLALTDEIAYPPGANKALRWGLAVELMLEYGMPVDPGIAATAADAKADYKRSNTTRRVARQDAALLSGGGYFNWRTGV